MSIESVMPSNHLILCCPIFLLPSIFPSIRVFSLSQFFASGGQRIGVSASTSVLLNEHFGLICLRMDWLDLLASKGLSRVFSNTSVQKHPFFGTQLSLRSNSHIHTWPLEKTIALTRRTSPHLVASPHLMSFSSVYLRFSYWFLYFWLSWIFVSTWRLSLGAASRDSSSLWYTGSRCMGFSRCSA